MKNLLILLALLVLVGVSSCKKEGTTPTDPNLPLIYSSPELNLPDYNTASSDLVEGTETQEIACVPPPPPPDGRTGNGPGTNDPRNPRMRFDPLGRVLFSLKLTPDQLASVKTFMIKHMDCVKAAMQALRLSEMQIMKDARQEQIRIMKALKDGSMTRAGAKVALQALNKATREKLIANPARERACIVMRDCMKALFEKIKGILDADQLVKFQTWLDSLKPIDCTPKPPSTGTTRP